jgi:D-inositol-3-phosphate glycosyltransferase
VRILLVSAYGLPHIGGIEVIVDELASQFAARGNKVTHLTSATGFKPGTSKGHYRIRRVRAINALETKLGVPYPIFGPGLIHALRNEVAAADVVHAHGFTYATSTAAFAIGRRVELRPRLILTEHVGHVPYESRLLNSAQRLAARTLGAAVLQRADALVTYNDRVRDQLTPMRPGVTRETILNGVDHRTFHPPSEEERKRLRLGLSWDDRPRVLFVGRPVAKKGFRTAVTAVNRVQVPVAMAVAGTEHLPAGTPPSVESLGRLSHQRLAEIYRACDVLLLPSWGEGFPLVAQEALASGLPVILADDPGYAPNLIGAGEGVRAVSQPREFEVALGELLSDPLAHQRARTAAATHAESAFSWTRAADEHEDLYRRLVDDELPRRAQGAPS